MKSSKESSDGSLSIRLTGQMTLNLEYEYRGQEVKISFENDYLVARLTDGTEFKVPVARGASSDSQVA